MKVERLATDGLIPYARNAKKHDDAQVAQIAASIREFGFNNPVLIDQDNGIIAGHGRVLAARKLGLAEVPCIRLGHLTDIQRRAYIIADNRLTETGGGWDTELLALELEDLRLEDFDLELTGFETAALEEILGAGVGDTGSGLPEDTAPEIDRAEELRQKWGVETGQLWKLGEHRLLCGDSTRAEDVARVMGGEKSHLMVTDPPYGVEYKPEWRKEAGIKNCENNSIGKVTNDDRSDWRECWLLFSGDVAYVWHAMKTQFSVAESLLACNFEIRSEIIWAKDQGILSRGHYHPQHESCFYAVRKERTGHWQGDRTQTTLWEINKSNKKDTGHSTQKPLECMARPIRNNSAPGDCIYEPFSGSGTTIIACENLKRRCRAIEISPAYVGVALERWHQHTGRVPERLP